MKTTHSTKTIGEGPLRARVLTEGEERERFKEQMGREHFLGDRAPAGGTVYQVIEDPAGHWCALLLWCSAGLRLKDRDAWIGWDAHQRSQRLKLVINNARFLIPENARKPNMASRALSVAVAAVASQYEAQYGYRPVLAETFTDPRRHKGTCYRAAGWLAVGETAGYGRHRAEFLSHHGAAKCIWVRPLQPDAQAVLCARALAPAQKQAQTEGTAAHSVMNAPQRASLYEALRQVPDPRRRAGQSYPCAPLLTVICLGLLAGAGTISSLHRLGLRMSDAERRALGFRRKAAGYKAPSYHTLRHLLLLLDLEALARVLTAWLQAHAGALPRHLALDGKDVRGALGMIVTLADAPSGIPVALIPAPGKGHEMKKAQQLLADPQVKLAQMTVTADALHCQRQTAHVLAQARGAEYVLQVKGNQPAVEDVARFAVPQGTPFLP
jgi:hypothetical protein